MKDRDVFHRRIWGALQLLVGPFLRHKFNIKNETIDIDGPCLIISNHVTDWDPLLVALSFPQKQFYFVASEHIFRLGFISKLIEFFLAPIPRRKASGGADTVMSCLRHLKAGHSVCLFAEGDAAWDGVTHKVFPATGKLARNSGATLLTYRLEGAYLSKPRWSKKQFRGSVFGHPVGIYTTEQLKAMTPAAITDIINTDIYENAWERQEENRTLYSGNGFADNIGQALYMCPKCGSIGTIIGKGVEVSCVKCGFTTVFDKYFFLKPDAPFSNIAQWDEWQYNNLKLTDENGDKLFSDSNILLIEIFQDHSEKSIVEGEMYIKDGALCVENNTFPLDEITMMAMVQKTKLLFSHQGKYFEIRARKIICLRKYLTAWEKTVKGKVN